MKPVIVWFRQDLRLGDNPALRAAAATNAPLVCVFVLDDDTPGKWAPGTGPGGVSSLEGLAARV